MVRADGSVTRSPRRHTSNYGPSSASRGGTSPQFNTRSPEPAPSMLSPAPAGAMMGALRLTGSPWRRFLDDLLRAVLWIKELLAANEGAHVPRAVFQPRDARPDRSRPPHAQQPGLVESPWLGAADRISASRTCRRPVGQHRASSRRATNPLGAKRSGRNRFAHADASMQRRTLTSPASPSSSDSAWQRGTQPASGGGGIRTLEGPNGP
jgi:hypothetical protein